MHDPAPSSEWWRALTPTRFPERTRATLPTLLTLALCLIALPGCTFFHKKPKSPPATVVAAAAAKPSSTVHVELGRIIRLQPEARTALVEFVPHARPPKVLAGRALLARKLDTLEVTAQLVASPHQRGRILGVYVISGTPALDDEVVLAPEQ